MTTRLIATWALLLGLAANAPAQLQIFQGSLNGSQETNPVNTLGTGFGTATYNQGTNMLDVSMSWQNLTGTTTDSHIHCCFTPANRNASVALGFSATFPDGVTSGTFNQSYDLLDTSVYTASFLNTFGGGTAAGARDALLAGMTNGTAYFNIHTSFVGSGEIRGDISPVPEPSTWALIGVGAVILGARARKRLRRVA
jgi:hypothetical protein